MNKLLILFLITFSSFAHAGVTWRIHITVNQVGTSYGYLNDIAAACAANQAVIGSTVSSIVPLTQYGFKEESIGLYFTYSCAGNTSNTSHWIYPQGVCDAGTTFNSTTHNCESACTVGDQATISSLSGFWSVGPPEVYSFNNLTDRCLDSCLYSYDALENLIDCELKPGAHPTRLDSHCTYSAKKTGDSCTADDSFNDNYSSSPTLDTTTDSSTSMDGSPVTTLDQDGDPTTTTVDTETETKNDGQKISETSTDITTTSSDGITKTTTTTTTTTTKNGITTTVEEIDIAYTSSEKVTTTITKQDGTVVTTVTEPSADNTTTTTTTTTNPDGTTNIDSTTTGDPSALEDEFQSGDPDGTEDGTEEEEQDAGFSGFGGSGSSTDMYTPTEDTIDEVFSTFASRLENSSLMNSVDGFFTVTALSGSCPIYSVDAWVFSIVIDQQCSSAMTNIWPLIKTIIILVFSFLAFRVAVL